MLSLGLAGVAGSWLWQLWRMRRWLEDPDQAPPEGSGIWGLIYDTIYGLQRENREARGRLQSTVDYLRSSFASMRDGVVILTQSGAIEWCNDAAGTLLGLQYPRDRGQPVLNLLRWPAFHDYFLAGEFQTRCRLPRAADSKQILQIEITTFAGGDFLIFARDVTRMVQTEQMRRDFVGNVSHELRTPLTVFKGYLDTIRSSGEFLDKRLQQPLAQMESQVQRMENAAQRSALAEPYRERARGAQERGSRHVRAARGASRGVAAEQSGAPGGARSAVSRGRYR
jgi:two-component system phosphate regulon sensor histidine kinase PhoR